MGSLALQGAGSVGLPGLSSTAGTGGSFYDWGAGLTLCQPLLDGGAASSAIDGVQQQTRPRAIALEQARQAIVLSVQTWWAWCLGRPNPNRGPPGRRAGRRTGAPPRCPAAL